VRYPSQHRPGLPSGIYVCREKAYDLSFVQPRQRTQVRRGLERCEVRAVDQPELLAQGFECNLDTMQRQKRFDSEFGERRQWRRLVGAIQKCPAINAFGAFTNGRLAAYAITCREGGWFHILHQMSRRDSLDQYPNHALSYKLTRDALQDPGVRAVCYGLIGLASGEGLHDYKLRLGYEVEPQNSVFLLHPRVERLLTGTLAARVVGLLRRARPDSERIERIDSVLRGARLVVASN
jgi:hypothetical protein